MRHAEVCAAHKRLDASASVAAEIERIESLDHWSLKREFRARRAAVNAAALDTIDRAAALDSLMTLARAANIVHARKSDARQRIERAKRAAAKEARAIAKREAFEARAMLRDIAL